MKHTLTLLSALLLFLAVGALAFAAPPPARHSTKLIVINDDGFSGFYAGRYKDAADLRAHILSYRDTPVAVFEWCITSGSRVNYPSKVTELMGSGLTEYGRRGDRLATETLRRLANEGVDTLAVAASACHEAGIQCYATMRMNGDYASKPGDDSVARQFNSDFWRAHPEWRVRGPQGEDQTKLSYAFPEVRAFKLAILREAAERDIDGIHLDFLRHPPFFGFETPLADAFQRKHGIDPRTVPVTDSRWAPLRAELMTGFLRDVRALLDEAGQKQGRHLGLSARIDWREHTTLGCDVATWLRENLLDYVAIAQHSPGGYEFDLAPFVALARGHGCALLFGEEAVLSGHDRTAAEDKAIAEGKRTQPKGKHLTLDDYRTRAAKWYADGADGLHIFNEHDPAIFRSLAVPAPLAALHAADAPSLQPPHHLAAPKAEHAVTNRAYTGVPSLAVAPKGRLWATWYAGVTPAEDLNTYVVLSTSGDDGTTWTEVLTVDPDAGGPVRSFDPELWLSPDGRLLLFWAQMEKSRRDAELGVWCIETSEPDSANPKWSAPRRIGDGVMMCKPLALSSGEWVLPISRRREHDDSAQCIVSTDAGKTWTRRGGCNVPKDVRQFDEHMFVERKDGSLWLLVRTTYGIGESVSTDRGKTWPELKPSSILHTPSRFFVRRLASGNLLLVKHGPLDTRTSRSHLTAYVSKDDGKTWGGGLMLDERLGVSYPDGQQTSDGLIRVIYDYNRTSDRNILMAAFREEDVAAGKDVSGAVTLRQLVSKATGGQEKPKPSAAPVHDNADGKPLRKTKSGTLTIADAKSQRLVPGVKLFTDRAYIAAELPAALKDAHFLPVAMNGQKTLKCDRPGTVFFLTPVLDRNRDTSAQQLMDQGFEKVALPEIPLFNPASSANFCTLFQKDCAAGETILIGKWAVPVFFP